MNTINFNQVGGFPLSTDILAKLQTAFSVFNALGALAGDKTIISGCATVGSIVSDGVVFINGEVFEFKGGSVQTTVKIVETVANLVFEDLNSKPTVKTRYVTFGTGVGAMNWADFKKPVETKALEAMLATVNSSLVAIVAKLATIETGAQVQLQSDFNQTDNAQKDYIKNKPGFINYLAKGNFAINDVTSSDNIRTVTFPSVGTNNYMVIGCMVSSGSNYDLDNDVIWMIREKANSSFKITLREVNGALQNLNFEYLLIPL